MKYSCVYVRLHKEDKLINMVSLNKTNNLNNKIYVEPDRTSPNQLNTNRGLSDRTIEIKEIQVERLRKRIQKYALLKISFFEILQ
jgi:hypothetical protein